jgi:four helix bundle protein
MNNKSKFDLEDRLVKFSIQILETAELLPSSKSGNHIAGQIIRCGTAPALNYAEAQSAESRNDFTHKMKISLKELRETHVCLKIIKLKPLLKELKILDATMKENDELISIFVKSISTAQSKLK